MIRSQQNFQTKGCSIAQQPAALTEAALEPCSGGAFHPGGGAQLLSAPAAALRPRRRSAPGALPHRSGGIATA